MEQDPILSNPKIMWQIFNKLTQVYEDQVLYWAHNLEGTVFFLMFERLEPRLG